MSEATKTCINHPRTETRVTCSSCGRPICVRCMRESAVGMKCPECARLPASATRRGRPRHYAVSAAAGLAAAAGVGAVTTLAGLRVVRGFILPVIAGLVVGEVVSRAAARQGGWGFRTVGGISTLAGLPLGAMLAGVPVSFFAVPPIVGGLLIAAAAAAFWAGR